jgi:hypothetical protein
MSKQHESQPDQAATEQQQLTKQGSARHPATAKVREMIASGNMDAKEIAAIVNAHPAAAKEIFALLHRTFGNQFASQVSALVGATPKMNASNFVIAPPDDAEEMMKAVAEAGEESGLGEPRDVATFDRSGEYMESRATVDGPAPEQKESTWVTKARRFNRAHADDVERFLGMTGDTCVDEATGEADPRKVARWQADHGVSPDGRVGDETVKAAAFTLG